MLLQKTYEAQSKLKYYMELKNNLINPEKCKFD